MDGCGEEGPLFLLLELRVKPNLPSDWPKLVDDVLFGLKDLGRVEVFVTSLTPPATNFGLTFFFFIGVCCCSPFGLTGVRRVRCDITPGFLNFFVFSVGMDSSNDFFECSELLERLRDILKRRCVFPRVLSMRTCRVYTYPPSVRRLNVIDSRVFILIKIAHLMT